MMRRHAKEMSQSPHELGSKRVEIFKDQIGLDSGFLGNERCMFGLDFVK